MGDSLFDQLKKAKLANKSQVHKARTEKHQQVKQQGNRKAKPPDETAQAIEQARLEKLERDRQLNAEIKAATDRKQLTGQIKVMINTHRQSKGVTAGSEEGVAYNFLEDNKVKTILVSKKVQQQLSRGQLAIIKFNDGYELIPNIVANKILARDPNWFITRSAPQEVAGEDDPYKDYKIPDDLMW
jgi:uncharacterized protein YaiL (DUF2058 family)